MLNERSLVKIVKNIIGNREEHHRMNKREGNIIEKIQYRISLLNIETKEKFYLFEPSEFEQEKFSVARHRNGDLNTQTKLHY